MVEGFSCSTRVYLYYIFSYTTLLALQYGDRVQWTWTAWDQAEENDISIREAECQIDVRLLLDEYPQWELGTPHQSIILHKMFLHATKRWQKEAECMVCWGC